MLPPIGMPPMRSLHMGRSRLADTQLALLLLAPAVTREEPTVDAPTVCCLQLGRGHDRRRRCARLGREGALHVHGGWTHPTTWRHEARLGARVRLWGRRWRLHLQLQGLRRRPLLWLRVWLGATNTAGIAHGCNQAHHRATHPATLHCGGGREEHTARRGECRRLVDEPAKGIQIVVLCADDHLDCSARCKELDLLQPSPERLGSRLLDRANDDHAVHTPENGAMRIGQPAANICTTQLPKLQPHFDAVQRDLLCGKVEANRWRVDIRKCVTREARRERGFTRTAIAHDGHDEEGRGCRHACFFENRR